MGQDLSREERSPEVFREWIDFMINEKGLQPTTVNIRIRTMTVFIRWCYLEQLIVQPIHEKFKPMKTAVDTIEANMSLIYPEQKV